MNLYSIQYDSSQNHTPSSIEPHPLIHRSLSLFTVLCVCAWKCIIMSSSYWVWYFKKTFLSPPKTKMHITEHTFSCLYWFLVSPACFLTPRHTIQSLPHLQSLGDTTNLWCGELCWGCSDRVRGGTMLSIGWCDINIIVTWGKKIQDGHYYPLHCYYPPIALQWCFPTALPSSDCGPPFLPLIQRQYRRRTMDRSLMVTYVIQILNDYSTLLGLEFR